MDWKTGLAAAAAIAALGLAGCRSDDAGIGGSGEAGHEDHAKSSQPMIEEEGTGGSGQEHEDTKGGSPLEGNTSAEPNYEGPDTDVASPSESDEREK